MSTLQEKMDKLGELGGFSYLGVDAAVRAGCPKCSGPVETVKDFGSTFVECDRCGFCERIN